MTPTVDDTRRADADAGHRGDTVTLLQDAAGSGHPVMFPGTLESRPAKPVGVEPPRPAGGYTHLDAPAPPDHTGTGGRAMLWLVDRLIALMRTAPSAR